ncbi:MDR family MFS transporter [Halomarina pelagica]|uniref:MDR family MFS transporter n=1 Tax=Halomarina pelagica TaxID=2961599 RepID=UPI0020C502F5|nr:MDR family MFS transporter [Halomarina sp. BND7]
MDAPTSDRRLVTLGVMLGIFLAGIDGTVVSTVMPTVVADLGGLRLYSWVFAAYMLFAAISMPLFGRLSDIYGRKRLFYVGVAVFVLGSALAGLSRTMPQLIAFRAVQGVGAGAMFAIPYTILGVIHPPEQRGRAIGYGSAVWGISSVVGPLLGYLIVTTLGWRWVFYLSVPVGIGAVALIARSLEETTGAADPHVDYAGALALSVGVGALLLALQLFETVGTAAAGALAVVGVAALVAFVRVERSARVPILPLSLFDDRVFVVTNAVGFLSSFVIFGAITYVPLFVQALRGGAGAAALAVFPISIGWSGTSFVSGRLVNRFGERALIATGTVLMTLGFGAATLWTVGTPLSVIVANVFVMGVGMGALTPPLLTAIQNHLGTERMGLATSSQQFFRNLGGTVGVAVLGVALNVVLRERFASLPRVSNVGDLQRLLLASGSPPDGLAAAMTEGLTAVFAASVVVCLLAVGLVVYLPRLRGGTTAALGVDD